MSHVSRRISIAAGIVGVALLGAAQTSAIAAPTEPAAATPAPAPVSATAPADRELGLANSGSPANAKGVCGFTTNGDYVHVSSSAFEASGHGWWVNGNCDATLAVVTVQLQEYYSDGVSRNIGSVGKSTVKSGGGAGNRATGRAGCSNAGVTGWRSVVDVDLVGLIDDPGKLTTPGRNIACRR